MDTFGSTEGEIIKSADRKAGDILREYQAALPSLADRLLEEKEITGQQLANLLKKA
jgi:ATP-dependent Zn protease